MAKLNVIDLQGETVGQVEVADAVFSTEVKEHLPAGRSARRLGLRQGARRGPSHGREDVQAEGHRQRPAWLAAG